jgi:hypothetical protein
MRARHAPNLARSALLALGAACAAGTAAAQAPRVELILAASGEPYTTVAARFESRWREAEPDEPLSLTVRTVADRAPPRANADLVVTVGVAALEQELGASRNVPLYATLVPRHTFEQLSARRAPARAASALWLDQPEARIARLTRLIVPRAQALGVLLGESSAVRRDALRTAGAAAELEVHFETPDETAPDPVDAMARLLRRVDAVLALPDPQVWNRVTVEPLLLRSFRARKPVLGVSASFVRAGAVAAVFGAPAQTGEELADRLRAAWRARAASPLPASSYPERFTVDTNPEVARELGLELAPAATLAERLRAQERAP